MDPSNAQHGSLLPRNSMFAQQDALSKWPNSSGGSLWQHSGGTNVSTKMNQHCYVMPIGGTSETRILKYSSSACPNLPGQGEGQCDYMPLGLKDRKEELKHLQPCRDFLHNRCFKGDKCIYSHDLEQIRHINTVQDGACMSFLFGVCELPLCRFRHDVSMVQRLVLAELVQDSGIGFVSKSGVCLEYLKGACTKDSICPFSHALKDYYVHVCKRKPHACISKRPVVENFVSTLSQCRQSNSDVASRCKRSYMLRSLIPSILPGDQKRAEAVVAVLEAHPCIARQLAPVYEDLLLGHRNSD